MLYISIPEDKVRTVVFNLALEEYVARNMDEEDCFRMWQVEPSVIFGRNQLIENEINLEFCREHDIKAYRRKSGGGCVYADMSNVMFSYITKDDNVNFTFNRYLSMVVDMLRKLDVDASQSGRNDIMIGDRKVSGNAFYRIPGRNIIHGTMLYDTDMENMVGSITPSDEKLLSKGVQSVRQRIALLKDYISIDINEFKQFVRKNMCDREICLTENDVKEVEKIEQEYLSPEFIYGNNPKYTITYKKRIEGVGELELRMELKNGVIKGVNIMGDYFLIGDIDNKLLKPLKNVKLERESLNAVVPDNTDEIILNLKKEDFIRTLLNE